MKIIESHNMSREAARSRIDEVLPQLLGEFGSDVSDISNTWNDDTMSFSLIAIGFNIKGKLDVTESDIIIDVGIPFAPRPFQGLIQKSIQNKLVQYFP